MGEIFEENPNEHDHDEKPDTEWLDFHLGAVIHEITDGEPQLTVGEVKAALGRILLLHLQSHHGYNLQIDIPKKKAKED